MTWFGIDEHWLPLLAAVGGFAVAWLLAWIGTAGRVSRLRQQCADARQAAAQEAQLHANAVQRLAEAEEERSRFPAELAKVHALLADKGAEVSGLLTRVQSLRDELATRSAAHAALHARVGEAETARDAARQRAEELLERATRSGDQVADLTARLGDLEQRVAAIRPLAEEAVALRDALAEREAEIAALRRQVAVPEQPVAQPAERAPTLMQSPAPGEPMPGQDGVASASAVGPEVPSAADGRADTGSAAHVRQPVRPSAVPGAEIGWRMALGGGWPAAVTPGVRDSGGPPPAEGVSGLQTRDVLRRINGIGPVEERALGRMGVRSFRQIAGWTDEDIAHFERQLGESGASIRRDGWVAGARMEHFRKYGECLNDR